MWPLLAVIQIIILCTIKEAPYSWFSLKHFLYTSESSRDLRVESSRSGEILKNYIYVCFPIFIDQKVTVSFFLVMRVWNLNIVLLNGFADSFQWVLRISVQFDVLCNWIQIFDLCCSFADYNKRILCTKTDISCAIISHNVNVIFYRKNMQTCFKLDEGVKITKQKTHNQFGFYSTRN